jgi:transposase InsO family protein
MTESSTSSIQLWNTKSRFPSAPVEERKPIPAHTRRTAQRDCAESGEELPFFEESKGSRFGPSRQATASQDGLRSRRAVHLPRRFRRVQMDHTLIDIMVVDEIQRVSSGRPWVTIAFDVATRVELAFILSSPTIDHLPKW